MSAKSCPSGHSHTSALPARLIAIDALRGLAMLLMLLDHVREFFYLHKQVADPMLLDASTEGGLFWGRVVSHICPTIFIFLSGVSAYLYAQRHQLSQNALSGHLLKRGLFLIVLEVTLVNFAWTFSAPPSILYLQVIWAIGLSMVALAGLIYLPRMVLLALCVVLVAGHPLLAPLSFGPESFFHIPWAVLHDRTLVPLWEGLSIRTSYPVLPWIGLMGLGYGAGHWMPHLPQRVLLGASAALLALFATLRTANAYGEFHLREVFADPSLTLMSFFNLTKYPPSFHYFLLTLGLAGLLLAGLRWVEQRRPQALGLMVPLVVFGRASMFFYLVHLYVLHGLYLACLALLGANQGERYGFASYESNIWLALLLAVPLYGLCKIFLKFKRKRSYWWLRYL